MLLKLHYMTPLSVAVTAGRTCWQSHERGGCYPNPTHDICEADEEFLDRILNKHKHRSVAEHIRVTFSLNKSFENELKPMKEHSVFTIDGDELVVTTNLRVLLDLGDKVSDGSIGKFLSNELLREISTESKFASKLINEAWRN